jgi:multidrug efflux pump subunit AcrA (membrane-fusion protein)
MNAILNFFKNKKVQNWTIAAVAALAALVLVFSGPKDSSAQEDSTATVVALDVSETIEASGSLAAQPFASLEWKTGGVVAEVNINPGDSVKQGDILLSLEPSSTSYSIAIAQSDLVQAQKDLEDVLKSDTARAQAAIDLQNAEDEYEDARDWRVSLNDETWINRRTYRYIGGRQVAFDHWYSCPEKFFPVIQMRCHCEERSSLPL